VALISLNSCPRCRGDVVLDNKDQFGWYEQCLQCGHIKDLQTVVRVEPQPAAAINKARIRRLRRKVPVSKT